MGEWVRPSADNERREVYIAALRAADGENFDPLLAFVSSWGFGTASSHMIECYLFQQIILAIRVFEHFSCLL